VTYSFPCQDISIAGKGLGMTKDSRTRSSLLWEVDRILYELKELPQVLIMENVPQVIGSNCIEDFSIWTNRLQELGYINYCKVLNAKDFNIPQNRARCFMVSILCDYTYTFPKENILDYKLKYFLDKQVDDKYYLSDNAILYINKRIGKYTQLLNDETEYAKSAITAVGNQNWTGNFVKCNMLGMLSNSKYDKMIESSRRVYSKNGISPTINTCCGGGHEIKIAESLAFDEQNGYIRKDECVGTLTTDGNSPKHNNRIIDPQMRVRKLTERECFRLMGVKDDDFEKIAKNQSMSSAYHLAGDSIVTTCLMAIFGELIGIEYRTKITEVAEEIVNN
jgi:DNA (cytosine-5)-methyltransferase 1